jgi:catechol 2,3-dioxygenase-like lactoylglutathione lyase family enzyme
MNLSLKTVFATLASPNVERLVDFYQRLCDRPPSAYRPDVYAEFHLPGLRLGIFQPRTSDVAEFGDRSSGRFSLCLEVDDLDSAIAHLTDLGYPPPGEVIEASHGREIYAFDPDGNRLILHQGN